jgi:hypothetical protein
VVEREGNEIYSLHPNEWWREKDMKYIRYIPISGRERRRRNISVVRVVGDIFENDRKGKKG